MTVIIRGEYTPLERKIVEFAFDRLYLHNKKNKSRHVTVLVKGKTIVEYGINDEKTSYTKYFGYLSRHSEYDALRRFLKFNTLKDLAKVNLWNVRINRFNEIVNSRPCRRCNHLLDFFPPKTVYYSDEFGIFNQF